MKKLKVITAFGTRPEIIRLAEVMLRLDECTDHIMLHTGQSFDYEMSEIFFKDLGLRKPDYFLGVKSDSVGGQIAKIIAEGEKVLLKEKPDALLVLGDTNSVLIAIIAKRLKIPIFHMEAGNRCFNDETPEEINRRIVDHIADINLAYSENSRYNMLLEGIHPKSIFVTGSPMREVITKRMQKIMASDIHKRLGLEWEKYFVVSFHREENVEGENFKDFLKALDAIANKWGLPIIVTTHPRTRRKVDKIDGLNPLIQFHTPFGFLDYYHLLLESFCLISDSGTTQEDTSILHISAIQVRKWNERPEGHDSGVCILTGFDTDVILGAIERVTNNRNFDIPQAYAPTDVSERVVRHILGLSKLL